MLVNEEQLEHFNSHYRRPPNTPNIEIVVNGKHNTSS
jgi:hypothetical protein